MIEDYRAYIGALMECTVEQACGGGEVKVRLSVGPSPGQDSALPTAIQKPSSTSSHGLCVLIVEVIDDGPGYGSMNADALFKPFYSDAGL